MNFASIFTARTQLVTSGSILNLKDGWNNMEIIVEVFILIFITCYYCRFFVLMCNFYKEVINYNFIFISLGHHFVSVVHHKLFT
jgi:hypothetical protein